MNGAVERAVDAGSAVDAGWLAAMCAIEHHEDHPTRYRAGVAARMVGLYGHLLAAQAALSPTGVRSPGGGGVPDGTAPPAVASGVACGPGGVSAGVSRAAPHPTHRPDR